VIKYDSIEPNYVERKKMIDGLMTAIIELTLADSDTPSTRKRVQEGLLEVEAICSVTQEKGVLRIKYLPEVISASIIRQQVEQLGLSLAKERKSHNPLKRFIGRMIKANEEAFGTEALDCCKLNSRPAKRSR
jgi:hypothetical protein